MLCKVLICCEVTPNTSQVRDSLSPTSTVTMRCPGPRFTLPTVRTGAAVPPIAPLAKPERLSSHRLTGISATITTNQTINKPVDAMSILRVRDPCSVAATQATHALRGRDDVGQTDTELVIDHHHLALGDQEAVDQHVHGLTGQRIQLDHRTLRQLQDVLDGNTRAPQLHRQLHGDVEDHVDVV